MVLDCSVSLHLSSIWVSKFTSLSLSPLPSAPSPGPPWLACAGLALGCPSLYCTGEPKTAQSSCCALTSAEQRWRITFLDLLVALPLAQGDVGLQGPISGSWWICPPWLKAFFSKATPWSLPILYLSHPRCRALLLILLNLVRFSTLSRSFWIEGLLPTAFYCSAQFGVICKLAESTFCPVIQVINKTAGHYWFQCWLLKNYFVWLLATRWTLKSGDEPLSWAVQPIFKPIYCLFS